MVGKHDGAYDATVPSLSLVSTTQTDIPMANHQDFLRVHSRNLDVEVASVADNCRFEERAAPERWATLDDVIAQRVGPNGLTEWADWRAAGRQYFDDRFAVPTSEVPDAFLEPNREAWLVDLEENQTLVRVEHLARPLHNADLTLADLDRLLHLDHGGDPDAAMSVREFVEAWNTRRDARPTFAAFYDEVRAEARVGRLDP